MDPKFGPCNTAKNNSQKVYLSSFQNSNSNQNEKTPAYSDANVLPDMDVITPTDTNEDLDIASDPFPFMKKLQQPVGSEMPVVSVFSKSTYDMKKNSSRHCFPRSRVLLFLFVLLIIFVSTAVAILYFTDMGKALLQHRVYNQQLSSTNTILEDNLKTTFSSKATEMPKYNQNKLLLPVPSAFVNISNVKNSRILQNDIAVDGEAPKTRNVNSKATISGKGLTRSYKINKKCKSIRSRSKREKCKRRLRKLRKHNAAKPDTNRNLHNSKKPLEKHVFLQSNSRNSRVQRVESDVRSHKPGRPKARYRKRKSKKRKRRKQKRRRPRNRHTRGNRHLFIEHTRSVERRWRHLHSSKMTEDRGSGNDVVDDDEDTYVANSNDNSIPSAPTSSSDVIFLSECPFLNGFICDVTLPFEMQLRKRVSNRSLAEVTSQVMQDLRSVILGDLSNSASDGKQCNVESARNLFCSYQNPSCHDEFVATRLCTSWCVEVITSCLPFKSSTKIHQFGVQLGATRAKSSVNKVNYFDEESTLLNEACRYVIDDAAMTSSSRCSAPTTVESDPAGNEDTSNQRDLATAASTCSLNGGFLCHDGRCIDSRWICDGNDDCGESEDEQNCVCSYNEFRCLSGQCVNQKEVCDGFFDCHDRSDERDCEECRANLTSCGNKQCINSAWWCDGDVDCANGKDEFNCSCESQGLLTCDVSKCFSPSSRCNGVIDCHDHSDEENCDATTRSQCSFWTIACDQSCVSITKQCDGILDCSSGADENNCSRCEKLQLETCTGLPYDVTLLPNFLGHLTQSEITRSSEYLLLSTLSHTRCHPLVKELGCSLIAPPVPLVGSAACPTTKKIARRRRSLPCRSFCNEVRNSCRSILASASMAWPSFLDCSNFPEKSNNSVETCLDGISLNEGICSSDEFRCIAKNDDVNQCVTMTSRCDGIEQCHDGSDEIGCDCMAMNRFQCRSEGRCIAKEWVCDFHKDCDDGSDEINCSNCSALQRACQDYSCVQRNQWCDGNDDCPDGSDETNCLALFPRGILSSSRTLLPPSVETVHNVGILFGYDNTSSAWFPVCSHSWDAILSHLACNQMGFRDADRHASVKLGARRNHVIGNRPITIVKNHRVRRVQETFSHRRKRKVKCRRHRFVHLRCRPKACGRQYDLGGARVFTRIMGGRTSRDNKWPWLASLQLQGINHVCGATLVRPRWIISAAHCFQERKEVSIWKVKIPSMSTIFNVSKIIIHPRYDSQAVDFDVALVRLDRSIRPSKINSLCLPTSSFEPGSYCVIAGWGITRKSLRGAHKLQEGYVHIIARERCQQYYPNHFISNRMMCAGLDGMVDACSGDSGGPLMCWQPQRLQWQLAGITSWGSSCTPNSAPGVYTDVKYFEEWIQTIMEHREFG